MVSNWSADAECVGMDIGLFFKTVGRGSMRVWSDQVTDACGRCRVRSECLAWAVENEEYGFWGGKTAEHRREIRRLSGVRLEDAPTAMKNYV